MNELAQKVLFLPEQASSFARPIDTLHYFIIGVTMVSSLAIGAMAVWFMARYRRRRVRQPTPTLSAPIWLEALIVMVPLVLFLLWFRIGFGQFVWMSTPPRDALDVYVVGKKWMWKFAYPGGPNGLGVLRVPVGRPVRLLLTSRDVIHSFFVPAFRVKKDALPGRYTEAWFQVERSGRYPVYCAEYCGLEHSMMRAEVEALEAAQFDRWLDVERRGRVAATDAQGSAPARPAGLVGPGAAPSGEVPDLLVEGRRIAAEQGCLKCHSVDGTAHVGPTFLNLYLREERLVGGERVVADEGYITRSIFRPEEQLVAGYPNLMPSYRGRLHAAEVAAVVEYLRSLRWEGAGEPEAGEGTLGAARGSVKAGRTAEAQAREAASPPFGGGGR